MPGLTFDTHKSVKNLKAAGFQESQAEALVGEIQQLQDSAIADLATKGDIRELKADIRELELKVVAKLESFRGELTSIKGEIRGELTSIRGEMTLLKWMMGFVLAGIVSLILKTFFG